MVSIPISTNIVKTIANLIYYLYSDNGNKQYRRMQTNKTSTRKRTTERERRASLTTEQYRQRERERQRETCQPYNRTKNMDRSSNSEQHRQMRERRISEEREQHRLTNSEKRRQSRSQNNLVSYQCIKYFTKLTKIFLHLITASANAYYIGKILHDRNHNTSGLSAGLASYYNNRTAIIGAIQKSMSVTSDNCTIIL